MERINNIGRRVRKSIIVIVLLILLGPSLDMNKAILLSLGFGASISLWSLSIIHESSFIFPDKN